jgi:hypothetical protein
MSQLPESVTITDDTMREGLQIESASIPVEAKLRLLDALGETGAKVISIGSFAHPKWTPQMACIDEIAERFVPKAGIRYTAAVFNKAGYDRADKYFPKLDVRKRTNLPGTAVEMCDAFARRNYNRTQAQQIEALDASVAAAKTAGATQASVGIGNPFGSNFSGPYTLAQRMDMLAMMIDKWHNAGITVTLASAYGYCWGVERAVQMAPDDDSLAGALMTALEASGQRERLLAFVRERTARLPDGEAKVELLRRAARVVGLSDAVAATGVWRELHQLYLFADRERHGHLAPNQHRTMVDGSPGARAPKRARPSGDVEHDAHARSALADPRDRLVRLRERHVLDEPQAVVVEELVAERLGRHALVHDRVFDGRHGALLEAQQVLLTRDGV